MASEPKFRPGDFAVHRQCGVGRIVGVRRESVAGLVLDCFVFEVPSRRLVVRVPVSRADAVLRPLASSAVAALAMRILSEKPRPLGGARWGAKMAGAVVKLNTGELAATAEVIRDVHALCRKRDSEFEPRVLEWAIERLADELAAIDRVPRDAALVRVKEAMAGRGVAPTMVQ